MIKEKKQNCQHKVGFKTHGYLMFGFGLLFFFFFSICRIKYQSKLGQRQAKEHFPVDLQGFAHSSLSTQCLQLSQPIKSRKQS